MIYNMFLDGDCFLPPIWGKMQSLLQTRGVHVRTGWTCHAGYMEATFQTVDGHFIRSLVLVAMMWNILHINWLARLCPSTVAKESKREWLNTNMSDSKASKTQHLAHAKEQYRFEWSYPIWPVTQGEVDIGQAMGVGIKSFLGIPLPF